ncbi:MAG: maleylpyruvate isomerase family mycothiol-dependent enzyme [Actinomycetota bacterium]
MPLDLDAHLRADSARFGAVLGAVDLTAPVPTCDGWLAADLLWHLTEVQHFWGTVVGARLTDLSSYEHPQRPGDDAVLADRFAETSSRLIEALAETEDTVKVWTWKDDDQTVGFVRRRQAHEALIHRLDAELTAGDRTAFDPDLATDGVIEALDWIFGGAPDWASEIVIDGARGLVATTDTGAAWPVQIGRWSGTNPDSGKQHHDERGIFLVADGAVEFSVAGAAADLDCWMWSRPPVGEVELSGDTAAFAAVIALGVD